MGSDDSSVESKDSTGLAPPGPPMTPVLPELPVPL